MPQLILKCAFCGEESALEFYNYNKIHTDPNHRNSHTNHYLITLTCGAYACWKRTTFEFEGMAMVGAPTRLLQGELAAVSDMVEQFVEEATNCFYGHAYRGTAALCRSAVEQALDEKGVPGHVLDDKIDNAKDAKVLGDEHVTQADAARLRGRNVLHRAASVTQAQVILALSACIELVNHIAAQAPVRAKP